MKKSAVESLVHEMATLLGWGKVISLSPWGGLLVLIGDFSTEMLPLTQTSSSIIGIHGDFFAIRFSKIHHIPMTPKGILGDFR